MYLHIQPKVLKRSDKLKIISLLKNDDSVSYFQTKLGDSWDLLALALGICLIQVIIKYRSCHLQVSFQIKARTM